MLTSFCDGAVFGVAAGDGPPRALLLHGWRRTHADFGAIAALLAQAGISSVALDLPGFGSTPPPATAMGARGYADVVAPLVSSMREEAGACIVVGHSFGGRVAACLAAAHPDAVAALVLSGVPLVRSAIPQARSSRRYRAVRAAARAHLVPARTLEQARRRHGSEDYRVATGVMRDVLVATVAESYEPELERIECPVSMVWGALDTTAPLATAQAGLRLCRSATLEVLDGVGHLVPTEAAEALAGAVARAVRGAP